MSDEEVRRLERAWHASRSDADGALWLAARERRGDLPARAVPALAVLEFGPAMELLGRAAPPPACVHLERTGAGQLEATVRLVLETARALQATWLRQAGLLALARAALTPGTTGLLAFLAWADHPPPRPPLARARLIDHHATQADALVAAFTAPDDAAVTAEDLLPALTAPSSSNPTVWRRVREPLLRTTLGPLPDWALTPRRPDRLRLVLAYDETLGPGVLEAAAAWLRGATASGAVPGLEVRVHRVVVPSAAVAPRYVDPRLRTPGASGPREVIVVASTMDGPDGYVARHHADDPTLISVWLDEFVRTRLRAPADLLLGHLALKKALEARLRAAQVEPPLHDPDVGCLFDLCRQKSRLDARIRTGALCPSCGALLRGEQAGLSPEVLAAVDAALEAGRQRLLAVERG